MRVPPHSIPKKEEARIELSMYNTFILCADNWVRFFYNAGGAIAMLFRCAGANIFTFGINGVT